MQPFDQRIRAPRAIPCSNNNASEGGDNVLCVREIFNKILEDYPELKGHLADNAEIVVDVTFERAVMLIAKAMVLTNEQLLRVQGMRLLPTEDKATDMDGCDNFYFRFFDRQKHFLLNFLVRFLRRIRAQTHQLKGWPHGLLPSPRLYTSVILCQGM